MAQIVKPVPEEKTCKTCDHNCPGMKLEDTCDNWEFTIFSTEVPEDLIKVLMNEPTSSQLAELLAEIDLIEGA